MFDLDNEIAQNNTREINQTRVELLLKKSMINNNYSFSWLSSPDETNDISVNSNYTSIEMKEFTSGQRAVIRGTRISVSTVIKYLLLGEKPEDIVKNILPNLSMAEIYEAIQYFLEFNTEIEMEIRNNTEEIAKTELGNSIGDVT